MKLKQIKLLTMRFFLKVISLSFYKQKDVEAQHCNNWYIVPRPPIKEINGLNNGSSDKNNIRQNDTDSVQQSNFQGNPFSCDQAINSL